MTQQNIYVGKDLGWKDLDTGEAAVGEYVTVSGDANPWYSAASPFGGPILPATFFHFQAYRHNPGWFPATTYGTLFARERFQWCRPLRVGEPARSHAWISEIQRKGDRWHITCDVDIYDRNDEIALRTRTTQTFLVDTEFKGLVRAPEAPANRRTSGSPEIERPGTSSMTSLRKHVSTEMCIRFFGGTRNYHTDAEESKKMGFGGVVVGGPMSVCYLGDMLTQNLGRDLFVGSDLDIRFIDILWPDGELEVSGQRAAESIAELDRRRTPFYVQVRDQGGRMTVVASGSCVTG